MKRGVLLLIAAGTLGSGASAAAQTTSQRYPVFSWDTVPRYMHLRKSKAFTDEELQYLAKFPIITLEKTTGAATYGSTERGSLAAARAIKARNPRAKVLYYRNVLVHYGGYDANADLERIPRPLLTGAHGNTKLIRGRLGAYDLSNPAVRAWWVDHCVGMAAHDAIDGIFLDGNIKVLEPAFLRREIGPEKKTAVLEGYRAMIRSLRERVGQNELLIANLLRARLPDSGLSYLSVFDGSYIEGLETPAGGLSRPDYVAKGIAAIQQAARKGKIICFSMGLGAAKTTGLGIDDTRRKAVSDAVQARLTYALALFLVCAERYSYFLAHDGYSVNNHDSSVWLKDFPEYERPLGPPAGPAHKEGYVYERWFEHASVWVDIQSQRANIRWH